MADSVQASCTAPVFKRPRLEYSPCESDTLISFESLSSEERFSVDSGLQEDSYEITSSNDCTTDSPPGAEQQLNCFLPNSSSSFPTTYNIENIFDPTQDGFIHDENLSSTLGHEAFNVISRSIQSPVVETEENDDQDSTISELSGLSELSNLSGQDWKPHTGESSSGPMSWVQRQMIGGVNPRLILEDLLPEGACIPCNVSEGLLWRLIINLLSEPRRTKLSHINTLDNAVYLLKSCKKIIVLTGAGVSVSCGIPDFRSRDGIYARLKKDYPALPDPQAMFDIHFFRRDPRPFFKFAKEIYPGQFEPSPSHRFIKVLENEGKLLRNYTQNIDTLEHAAGIQNAITCHGSFATASCTLCGNKVESSVIKEEIFQQRIPYCPICPADLEERGIMKPDIVFFGESLSSEFREALDNDKHVCDLLIVIGSSLNVRPVAMIPSSIPTDVPQILINREPLDHLTFDIELLGDCDVVIGELCKRLEHEWEIDDRIPRFELKEVVVPPPLPYTPPIVQSEVNNNSNSVEAERPANLPQSEESNSCDCRGMSAIKLDDSEDGSNQEQPSSSASVSKEAQRSEVSKDKNLWTSDKESQTIKIPDGGYLYFPPSRYIFPGADLYKLNRLDTDDEEHCSTPTDYSSDCDSPRNLPVENTTDIDSKDKSELTNESSCKPEHNEEETKQSPLS